MGDMNGLVMATRDRDPTTLSSHSNTERMEMKQKESSKKIYLLQHPYPHTPTQISVSHPLPTRTHPLLLAIHFTQSQRMKQLTLQYPSASPLTPKANFQSDLVQPNQTQSPNNPQNRKQAHPSDLPKSRNRSYASNKSARPWMIAYLQMASHSLRHQ